MIDTTGKPGNPSNVMAEDSGDYGSSAQNEQSQTMTLPLSLWEGQEPKEGEPVPRLVVVSVDSESGAVNVAKATALPKRGSDGLAEQFDQPKQEGAM